MPPCFACHWRGRSRRLGRPGITPKPFTTWDVISVTVSTRNGLSGGGLTYELRAGGEAVRPVCATI